MRHSLLYRSTILIFTFFLLIVATLKAQAEISQEERQKTYQQLEVFANILSLLQDNYVEEIDSKKTINGAIRGLLYSLDPHSSYLDPEEFKELQEETQGQFSGIGIEITIKDDVLSVISPIEGTPADLAGLKAKDIIVEINGEKTKEMGAYEAVKRLRGPKGSDVTISISREGWDELKTFTLKRDLIPLQSVKAHFLEPGIAYTRITNFQSHTTSDYVEALSRLAKQEPITGLILDLRNNPGGLLNQAVSISDTFLEDGMIVSTKGRTEDQNMSFKAHKTPDDYHFPLVVLVNEGSASASEIVAGAIQDHKRGIIVGTRTFGKGSVQTIIPLPGDAGLRLTTAKYYTPAGKSIQALGISPDVEVTFIPYKTDGAQKQDLKKQRLREEDLKNHFPGTQEGQSQPEEEDGAVLDDFPDSQTISMQLEQDNQLRTALNILKSLNLYFRNTKK
ncbi:S41 family peptidase [Desulfopila aestuarii]|uniref:Carboxyl-terminal processing protease n=1 Tax=Desulfopila aestuarii DSM 18488 TaxID=1121416 RepID=A0A1M7Y1D0_9BACT|nr:S41 family peptidase [Desulfopila aestuarii]SHO45572.1 carboxyl-terminal processing protease [Desulfopila aestuarii DSM 18488]